MRNQQHIQISEVDITEATSVIEQGKDTSGNPIYGLYFVYLRELC